MTDNLIDWLMTDYGINRKQAKFVVELVKNGGNKTRAHKAAGYKGSDNAHCANAVALIRSHNVKQAYEALTCAVEPNNTVEDLKLSKQRVLEDLELLKRRAAEHIEQGKGGGGAYSGFVRATELQGRVIGMFRQHHYHKHEHQAVPTEELIRRLQGTQPVLAATLAQHLGIEFDESQ